MNRTSLLLTLALSTACNRTPPTRDAPDVGPPNLSGVTLDDQGDERTLVDILGVLRFGDTASDELPGPSRLVGYEFEAFQGAIPVVELGVDRAAGAVVTSLYGPRTDTGVWSAALASRQGDTPGTVVLDDEELPQAGRYLVLLQSRQEGEGAPFALHLGCRGNCGEPVCPHLEPCEKVCRDGYVLDALGCPACQCVEAPECEPGAADSCAQGELCGDDGRCHADGEQCKERCPGHYEPVCGEDRIVYGNPCYAECAGVRYMPGECDVPPPGECGDDRPCPEPEVCDAGRCRPPPCDCPDVDEPMCSRQNHTYRNACRMECAGEAPAYPGACRPSGCRSDRECPGDLVCLPAPEVPGSREACARDENSPQCVRRCLDERRPPDLRECDRNRPCEQAEVCYPLGRGGVGVCVPICRLEAPEACVIPELACAAIDADLARRGGGLCLPRCEQRGECPLGTVCRPDLRGDVDLRVCQRCECGPISPGEEVCTDDQRTFPSACHAECAGARQWRAGPCEAPDQCICGDHPDLFCADDGVLYTSLCEARCRGEQRAEAPPDRCLHGGELPRRCERDEQCIRTGCEDLFCAAGEPNPDLCAHLSPPAMCWARHGGCGCVDGVCRYTPTQRVERCLMAM